MASTRTITPKVVIIGDGLINARINPANQYVTAQAHLGNREIERLFGFGRDYGKGPLPHFLREAIKAAEVEPRIAVILLQDKPVQNRGEPGSEDDLGVPVEFKDIFDRSLVIETEPRKIAWDQLHAAISSFLGDQVGDQLDTLEYVRFLLVGSYTEGRPLAIATQLKNVFGYSRVSVCSHLIGSREREAHFAALRHTYFLHGVEVFLNLQQAREYIGIKCTKEDAQQYQSCVIHPPDIRDALGSQRRRIIELLCMHWTKCVLRPLAGGFSGSALFVAEGWKLDSRTEPMVLKIDNLMQMRREISGYNEVKDLLGKHIPQFGYPVTVDHDVGVGMELATMDGKPETLQDSFEEADFEGAFAIFMRRFERALTLIASRLYDNTKKFDSVNPYHRLGLSSPLEVEYLRGNSEFITGYLSEYPEHKDRVQIKQLTQMLKMVSANTDGVDSETCIVHGDLNLQNIICDNVDNVWFIDWTHCGRQPIELDFAKLENDIKFVISKDFGMEDLENLRKFETYLISEKIPAEEKELPEHLRFVKWDLRYRKILSVIRLIRTTCFSLKKSEQWIVYRIALLKYSLHTLSFDERRDRGECKLHQLVYALRSTELLLHNLVTDDFHMKIRGAKPQSYPARQRISIDYAPWRFDCPEYAPPYYVSPEVIANENDWADPENMTMDRHSRPLHPKGRTGLSGRGLLGRWGANPAVNAVIFRLEPSTNLFRILLGKNVDSELFSLPGGFVGRNQSPTDAIKEVTFRKFGIDLQGTGEVIHEGYSYDERQTDNAWVETTTFLYCFKGGIAPVNFSPNREYDEVNWHPVGEQVLEAVHPGSAETISLALKTLQEKGVLEE